MKTPHLLLASANPRRLRENLVHILTQEAIDAIDLEINENVLGLLRLGEEHLAFAAAVQAANWRQIISRTYYGAYSCSRAVRLCHDGHFSTDSTDHKKVGDLPAGFPQVNMYANRLPILRDDRNLCDYDHSASVADLAIPVQDARDLVAALLKDSKAYLIGKGVRL